MEFTSTTIIAATAADLQRRLTIGNLPQWCVSIEKVLRNKNTSGEIYCVWGTFEVHRENLCNGVRFSLPGCPYAFQWTVTTGFQPNPQHTVIHLTLNGTKHEQDFIDSIQQFVADWKAGLETNW